MTTLRQQIGQMLIIGFAGTQIEEHSSIVEWLSGDGLGGVILFDYDLVKKSQGKNLVNQSQIKYLTNQIHHYAKRSAYSQEEGRAPFIAIDYEGGAVDRLKHIDGCIKTKKPCELATLSDEALRFEAEKMAQTLKALGFNLNFAPVVDLNLNEDQGIIGKLGRSFSAEPSQVAHLAKIFVEAFADQGLTCCYKHFPGHGSAIGDSHEGFVDVTGTFQTKELEPYSLLLANPELPAMIMTAHVINRKLDASGLPATLSHPMLTGLLRHQLGFEGVIISDDLQMQAIASHYSVDEALELTINAGADMVIFANQLGEIGATEVIDRIEALVRADRIEKKRIEQAFQRIVRLKQAQLAMAL
ncbi:Beta-hexosaminidase A precursor [Legionella massiliensis]|uniref:beta-N-acetylhexosaminidase n=1 Tax=Legionella massiliensis TaxID=1034943 RepID=A0A078L0D8_9GAMM|nr:glycoside hydrolase family 3 N-terminal domain-containing protein [Legionella massiliensis]CDZ78727.1 Beta-hexosaminidase A precursor [Legionella massiliensis]CEE14465.1 putative lipoprotein YbbD precursor [Legionella massiliensis]